MPTKRFLIITLITSIWINISEVFRYFVIVRPRMHNELSGLDEVAEMDWGIFAVWGVWDTILSAAVVFSTFLAGKVSTSSIQRAFMGGGFVWVVFFVLFWIGMWNMQLASLSLALIALPLALVEMLIGAYLAGWLIDRESKV